MWMVRLGLQSPFLTKDENACSPDILGLEKDGICLQIDVLLVHQKNSKLNVLVEDHLQLCPPLHNLYY